MWHPPTRFHEPIDEPTRPLIGLDSISKRFGSLWANREISLEIWEGEIHAVVGENGAGKSTLMGILYGHLQPDAGKITWRGQEVIFPHPQAAMRAGIGLVHQRLLVFPQLTSLENIVVGSEPGRWGGIGKRQARERLETLCRAFDFDLPLDSRAGELAFAHHQQIEILRVLYRGAQVLILDEPTSLLAPSEIERLIAFLQLLRESGRTIVFISHRLREVFALADRISILRRGRHIKTLAASEATPGQVARWIVSGDDPHTPMAVAEDWLSSDRQLQPPPLPFPDRIPRPLVRLEQISVEPSLQDSGLDRLTLHIHEGEILGLGGVVGNGLHSLAHALSGILPVLDGHLFFGPEEITRQGVTERLRKGLRWLPAHPMEEAFLPSRPLWENVLLGSQRQPSRQVAGWLLKQAIFRWVREALDTDQVVYGNLKDPLERLSGGNQQRVALARVLSGSPRFALLEQPGRGLDIEAQKRLHDKVLSLNQTLGVTFLILSHDLDELIALTHRIGILYRGHLMGVLNAREASRQTLGRWMLGLQ